MSDKHTIPSHAHHPTHTTPPHTFTPCKTFEDSHMVAELCKAKNMRTHTPHTHHTLSRHTTPPHITVFIKEKLSTHMSNQDPTITQQRINISTQKYSHQHTNTPHVNLQINTPQVDINHEFFHLLEMSKSFRKFSGEISKMYQCIFYCRTDFVAGKSFTQGICQTFGESDFSQTSTRPGSVLCESGCKSDLSC